MTKEYVKIIIREYSELAYFTGGVEEEEIIKIEKELNLRLPESYKWFLLHYGYGGVGGTTIEGVVPNGILTVVEQTLYQRKQGLPEHLVVIQDSGEFVDCLDVSEIKDEDCSVVNWSMHDNDGVIKTTSSFFDYLLFQFYDEEEMVDEKLYAQWEKVFDGMIELRKHKK